MELDFKYSQYSYGNEGQKAQEVEKIRPHQELFDLLTANEEAYKNSLIKNLVQTEDKILIPLENGTVVQITRDDGVINMGIKYQDGSRFIGLFFDKQNEDAVKSMFLNKGK